MHRSIIGLILILLFFWMFVDLTPEASQAKKSFSRIEYGFVAQNPSECNMNADKINNSQSLHYFAKRDSGKLTVEFFCYKEDLKGKDK